MFKSSLPSQVLAVPVALAQQNMKEVARRLAIARTGGGMGQFCDAPGTVAPAGARGDARVRTEGASPRAPTSIDFAFRGLLPVDQRPHIRMISLSLPSISAERAWILENSAMPMISA